MDIFIEYFVEYLKFLLIVIAVSVPIAIWVFWYDYNYCRVPTHTESIEFNFHKEG